jgi:uncharacterized protein (DUF4415 family)
MGESERIVSYTSEELRQKRLRGETKTDWAKLDALTPEEIEASIDFEEEGYPDWGTARRGIPGPQQRVTMPIDTDVYEWFEAQGIGYKTKMNEVLREYVEAKKKREAATAPRT